MAYTCVECGRSFDGEPADFEGWEAFLSRPGELAADRPLDDPNYQHMKTVESRCWWCVDRERLEIG